MADKIETLNDYYNHIQNAGKLLTIDHAVNWSNGTLQMLGVNLSGKMKRALKKSIPAELQTQLGQVFWIAYFRDTNMPASEFATRVARRSRASSDPDFALYPIQAVFGGLKGYISSDLSDDIRDDLSPELSKIWETA